MAEASLVNFTDELLESNCLYCGICKDILKPPIMLVESIGNICSTCHKDTPEIRNRHSMNNEAIENILKLLKLPCKYKIKGCQERFSYEELPYHQQACKFGTKMCSMNKSTGCEWQGSTGDFIAHFKQLHGDHVINFENNLFFLETSLCETNMVKLLVTHNQIFMLRMHTSIESKRLLYMICSVTDNSNSFCDYSVKHKGSSDNYIKTKSRVMPSYYIYNDFDESVAVAIDLDALKQISQISNTITNVFKIKIDDGDFEVIDDKILHFFECPVCKTFMKPPIYQCHSGHSICNMCRPRVDRCPTCRSTFGNTRNYSLEGLTVGVQYPCIYHDSGCPEIGSTNYMTSHEKQCQYKPLSCPFPTCATNSNQEVIVQHLIDAHFDSCIYSGSTGYTDSFRLDPNSWQNKILNRKCVIAFNHIFRLTCRRTMDYCYMAVEIIGCKSELKTFVYEVSIMDVRKPEKKLIRTDYCLTELSEDDVYKKCIMFPNSVLSSYSNHGVVTFNISIKEK